ncbi:hypothetical protein [Nocardia blacklockiae]|uniref:hypothetical protein n=1 Tax=Nocardia blacklockiae TaxID=480036 RepID=UPI001893D166|nr:hypothetical protein [Nocardia blacklockiae]MBF6171839.1 hypothetical protein [Nocardia blacklockiae]
MRTALAVVGFCLVAAVFGGATARADGGASGADLTVAQSLGDRELTVIVRRAQPVPGPLRVDVVTHSGSAPGTLTLAAVPVDRAGDGSSTTVNLGERPGPYAATLRVDHAGPWELTVGDGERAARIPFVVAAQVVTPWERAAYGGFFAAGALLLVSVGTALVSRRGRLALLPAGAMVAALAVGVTGATLSASAPPPRPAGSLLDPTSDSVGDPYPERDLPMTTNYARPPANLAVRTRTTVPGQPTDLILTLTDSATGRPVDDLLVTDDALLHLMIVGPAAQLWHRHPIRTAPGTYELRLPALTPGDYAVAAELSRRGGGTQLLRAALKLPGTSPLPLPGNTTLPPTAPPSTPRTTSPTAAPPAPPSTALSASPGSPPSSGETSLTATDLVAGVPGTLTARFGGGADLQLWLGMLGHLIAVGPLPDGTPTGTAATTAPIWAHAHAMAPMLAPGAQPPDETVAAYGPDLSFTYTFPLPGRYLVWAQAERGYSVLTVPAVVEVKAGAPQ